MHTRRATSASATQLALVGIGLVIVSLATIVVTFDDAVAYMARSWRTREFMHAPLVLLAAGYLAWRQREALRADALQGSWMGVLVCALGAVSAIVGQLASLFVITQYGVLICVYGLVLSAVGPRAFRRLWGPLLLLVLVVPLPQFLRVNLLAMLQGISALIGVGIVRLAGISVHAEGDVLDFGGYALRLADVGAGLQFVFPFVALAFVIAYLSTGRPWLRTVVFLASVPVMVVMNGVSLGLAALWADRTGALTIEPFLRTTQPWLVVALSAGLLGIGLLASQRRSGARRSWDRRDRPHGLAGAGVLRRPARGMPKSLIAATLVFLATAAIAPWLTGRASVVPERTRFAAFPMSIGSWTGQRSELEAAYRQVLKLDDYLLADYRAPARPPVNAYVAWYDSQQAGRSAHSPRACLPGDGWRIEEFGRVPIEDPAAGGESLQVNRAVIVRDRQRQVVYYWFQQRGRWLTNEYAVKWFLLWDRLTHGRSDGALVRLTVALPERAVADDADTVLADFARDALPALEPFVPR